MAVDLATRAGELSDAAGNERLRAIALYQRAWSESMRGRYQDCLEAAEASAGAALLAEDVRTHEAVLRIKGVALGQLRRHEYALTTLDQAIGLADQHRDPVEALRAYQLYLRTAV